MDTLLYLFFGTIALISGIRHFVEWRQSRQESRLISEEYDDMNETQDILAQDESTASTPDTMGLMFKTLINIGCQPRTNADNSLSVQYQGEKFHMEFGGMYTRVWNPMWAVVKADDPELHDIRAAVNSANFNFGPTVVLSEPNEDGVIGLSSRRDIMLHPACPDNEPFVKAVLDSFFDAKEEVRSNFQQINAKQMEAKKNRRPIGFTTTTENNPT